MKKVEDFKREIKQLGRYDALSKREKKIVNFYNKEIIPYLLTNPSQEYLKDTLQKIEAIIASKKSQYEYWCRNVVTDDVPLKQRRTFFNKETGITELKKRVKTLKIILT